VFVFTPSNPPGHERPSGVDGRSLALENRWTWADIPYSGWQQRTAESNIHARIAVLNLRRANFFESRRRTNVVGPRTGRHAGARSAAIFTVARCPGGSAHGTTSPPQPLPRFSAALRAHRKPAHLLVALMSRASQGAGMSPAAGPSSFRRIKEGLQRSWPPASAAKSHRITLDNARLRANRTLPPSQNSEARVPIHCHRNRRKNCSLGVSFSAP